MINSSAANILYFHVAAKAQGGKAKGVSKALLATSGVRQVLAWNVHTGDIDFTLPITDPQDANPCITSLQVDRSSTYVRLIASSVYMYYIYICVYM